MLSRRIKHIILALTVVFSTGLITVPAMAATDFKGDACAGLQSIEGNNTSSCPTGSDSKLTSLFRTIISLLSMIVGLVAVIMVIVGGFKYITSGGDSSNTSSAKSTIIYALIGLMVAALAQVLVHFVLFQTTGAKACPTNGGIAATSAQCKAVCPTNSAIPITSTECKK